MGHGAWLRTYLASRRGVTAAAAAAAALLIAQGSTADASGAAWTKAWAEHEVREHFGAVTAVCLPLGKASHDHGSKTFAQFVCAFATGDGTRYTIRLKPRTRTTWTTLSFKKAGKPAPKTGGGHSGSGTTGGKTRGGPDADAQTDDAAQHA
jgi:Flp pilus assembly protein TadG